jgi:chemotaxis signal transduction protein
MSAAAENLRAEERLLTFEVAGDLYAIPIAGVLEVAEVGRLTCIPTLATRMGGVINHHGDALPVINCASLFDVDESALGEPGVILVIAGGSGETARLGIPIDRVLGLVDGAAAAMSGTKAIAERRSIQGRVASVLDPERLVSQARNVIESSLGRRD